MVEQTGPKDAPHAAGDQAPSPAGESPPEQPDRILQESAATTRSIANAVVLKDGDLFFLSEPGGFIPEGGDHGFGLYYHDCRFLAGYDLSLASVRPDVLVSTTAHGFLAVSQLTTPDLIRPDGGLIPKEHLSVKRELVIEGQAPAIHDLITFQNYDTEDIVLPLTLHFRALFEDIFAVRGLQARHRGHLLEPTWDNDVLTCAYEGSDELCRVLAIHFSRQPRRVEGTTAHFRLSIPPRKSRQILISHFVAEQPLPRRAPIDHLPRPNLRRVQAFLKQSSDEWLAGETEIQSNSLALNTVLDRSLRDLRVLRSRIGDQEFFAAGVPWYATLFGRDSLITALQMLAYDPAIAEQTLRVLARYQGEREDPWRDEEPGKILHELRLGELARTGEIPHTPYYGTVDATPLFLILLGRHAAWTGDLTLFRELRDNVERALTWMDRYGDLDGDGYLEYACRSASGLANQGWKDSWDGIVNADGSLATPPIALAEVQGYVYLAKMSLADLFRRNGDEDRARQLETEARDLRTRFNRDFWLEDLGCYALALQAHKRPAAVVASNAGLVLWSGIADRDKAARTVERLFAEDMFSGWGIRTLSEREKRFNPTGYHLGTVWPHDNSFIASGCRRYGFSGPVLQIFGSLVEAAMYFPDHRLPELFMGFRREDYGVPVSYPVACRPQAWAAGAVPHLVRSLLGLQPEAFENRLRILQPVLPRFIEFIEVHRLRVGGNRVDLRFERAPSGNVAVDVRHVEGSLDVVMELQATRP